MNNKTTLTKNENMNHYGRFELVKDEETGRKYWWGAEEGWKDPTEIGEDGVITIEADSFEVGTIIELVEPVNL